MIFGAFERLGSYLTCHGQLPLVLDITRVSPYIFSRWLDGKMGTKMSRRPAQLKTKFLYMDTPVHSDWYRLRLFSPHMKTMMPMSWERGQSSSWSPRKKRRSALS